MSDPLNASAADALVSAAAVVVGGGGASLGDSVSARLPGYSPEQERSKKLGASGPAAVDAEIKTLPTLLISRQVLLLVDVGQGLKTIKKRGC